MYGMESDDVFVCRDVFLILKKLPKIDLIYAPSSHDVAMSDVASRKKNINNNNLP